MTRSVTRFDKWPGDGRNGERLCGVEVEFAGLSEKQTADIVIDDLGGSIAAEQAHFYEISDTSLGGIKVELDIFLKDNQSEFIKKGLSMARNVIPVEIVTDPLRADQMPELDRLCDTLRDAGALGSRKNAVQGFGVHLNPETPADEQKTCRIVMAYALLEDWLREVDPIDGTRWLLPFVDPWPRGLTDALVQDECDSLDQIMDIYARHTKSRNHGLDMLPVFKDHDAKAFDRLFEGGKGGGVSGRPAFHFRLPDCRIDEPDWSLAVPWQSWAYVEKLAQNAAKLTELRDAWLDHRDRVLSFRSDWADIVSDRLGKQGGALA